MGDELGTFGLAGDHDIRNQVDESLPWDIKADNAARQRRHRAAK